MKNRLIALLAFAFTFGFAGMAYAQDAAAVAEPSSAAGQILLYVIEVASALLIVFLTWASAKVGGWLKAKTGIEVDALLDTYAAKGVAYAEEKAHQYLAEKDEKLKGSEKLEVALNFALGRAEQNKLPEKAKDKLVGYIEAKLGQERSAE